MSPLCQHSCLIPADQRNEYLCSQIEWKFKKIKKKKNVALFTYCLEIKVKNVLHLDVFLQSGGLKKNDHSLFIQQNIYIL